MTKDELKEIVVSAYSMYNQVILDLDKKNIFLAWWEILQDLPYAGVKQSLIDHACISPFMPKPGDLRRRHIDATSTVGETPSPLAAWGIVLRQITSANSGVASGAGPLHPCIVQVMEELGDTLYQLHSTTDQINFIKAYEQVVSEFQAQKYKISETGAQA